jgi:hypothetical protein
MMGGDKRAEKVFTDDFEATYRHLMERARVTQEEMAESGGVLVFFLSVFLTSFFLPFIRFVILATSLPSLLLLLYRYAFPFPSFDL